jgi:hypothetical protein
MANDCLDSFSERSTVVITVAFTDDDGAPVTPDSATYRIDDRASRTSILPVTAIGSLASSVDLTITSEQNAIIRSRKEYEIRTITVEFDYNGSTKHGTAQYEYKLVNLYGVVDVASASVSPSASPSPSA